MGGGSGSSGVDGMSQDAMLDTDAGQFVADLISDFEQSTGNILAESEVQSVNNAIANAASDGFNLSTSNINNLIRQGFAGTLAPGAGSGRD